MNATNRIVVLTATIIGLIATASAQPTSKPTSAPTSGYKIQETRLGPMVLRKCSLVFSRDGRHVAIATPRGQKKQRVIVDGKAGAEYFACGHPVFSPDSKRVVYKAKKGATGAKWLIVVNGKEVAEYHRIGDHLTFGSDGILEYIAWKDNSLYRVKHIPVR